MSSRHHSRSRTSRASRPAPRNQSRNQSRSRSRVAGSRSRSAAKPVYVPKGISAGRARRLVFDGVYQKTRGGLVAGDLKENKQGKVVSIKKAAQGKRLQKANPYRENKKFMKYKGKVDQL